jgi:1-deoxy-D-xylulose-5-phosphate synthase
MRFVKPLDTDIINHIADSHDLLITIEENAVMGGAGSAVNEYLREINHPVAIKLMGLPDTFIEHGVHSSMLSECGLDATGILHTINQHFAA